ncbi:MAG: GNAT family N-acetyltransferase [Acidobacteria bacterium]|nr:GNAT family N-acetyltransferase [Acidobacteriota bacterium]
MSEKAFTIRRATAKDVEKAFELIQALGYTHLDGEAFKRVFKELLQHQDALILLAEHSDGRALGLMTLSQRPQLRLLGNLVCIDELVVADAARGLGIGGALLQEAKAFATTIGAQRLELNTRRSRESYRRAFYVKNGFSEADSAIMRLEKDFFK